MGRDNTDIQTEWSTSLCDCTDPDVTCYTLTSCPCAVATGLTDIEGKQPRYEEWCCWLFAACTFPLCVPAYARIRAREGYGIGGSVLGDVCVSWFCPCCSTRQIWSETKIRGKVEKKKTTRKSMA